MTHVLDIFSLWASVENVINSQIQNNFLEILLLILHMHALVG